MIQKLRKFVLERDKHTCQNCRRQKNDENLHIHHIDGNNKNNEVSNLMTICVPCHTSIHSGLRSPLPGNLRRILAVITDEAYVILKRYKEAKGIGNLDSALDEFLKEKGE